ncbi:MAG: hypothetical protein E7432_07085 [Ruminococcaceae bacterium]|nr:hypothetical protein [Oscillospiraceae bacterium]
MDEVKIKARDNRLTVVAVLRKIFGYSIFLMLIYCFITYREDINMLNFYRIMSYFDTDTSVSENFTGYTFEVGIDSVHSPFGGGLVVLNKDSLKIINAAGLEDLSEQLKYSSPQLLTGDKRIIAYDKGGNEISIFGSYALLKQLQEENPVLWCNINKQGDLLVLFEEPGYKGSVKLYSEDSKQQFQWSSSEYYIISGCINNSGEKLSLLCVGGENRRTFIRTYNIHNEEPLFEIDLGETIFYSMEYDNNDNLSVITENGLYTYDKNGQETSAYTYSAGSLSCYSHENGEMPLLSIVTGSGKYKAVLVNDGEELHSFETDEEINGLFYETGTLSALTNENAYLYETSDGSKTTYSVYAAKSISKRIDGSYLVIFSDRAEVLGKSS